MHFTETVLHSFPVLHFTDSQGSMHVTISNFQEEGYGIFLTHTSWSRIDTDT